MPLCTLEIPRSRYTPGSDQDLIRACEITLDRTLQGLDIPDPQDREYRITVIDGLLNPEISISFTLGTDEYKTGTIFNPPKEQILSTTQAILASSENGALGVKKIIMQPWFNTTFLIRSTAEDQALLPPVEFQKREPGDVGLPTVTLVLSPDKLTGISSPKEGELPKEPDDFQKVGKEILKLLKDKLKLPEQIEGQTAVLYPRLAQTDISVEVDFPDISKPLSPEERLDIAKSVEHFLNVSPSLEEGSATIWIRQGKPATEEASSIR